MPESSDNELLRRYAETRAEEAFAEVVRRHVNLVYSAALRQTGGNAHTAQDVTQAVFAEMARQAGKLARHPALSGWLYTATRHFASHEARAGSRRARREQEAHVMQELSRPDGPEVDWQRLAPVLDDAMHELNEVDRHAVLLRFFEGRDLRAVGASLGLGENAARMRVDRALDKLRRLLERRGVRSTSAALAAALAAQTVTAAPAAVVTQILAGALVSTATGFSTLTLLKLMASTKIKLAVATLIAAGAVAPAVHLNGQLNRLREENRELSAKLDGIRARPVSETPPNEANNGDAEHRELLRLRGEVGQLRQQIGVLEENRKRLMAGMADSRPERPAPNSDEALRAQGNMRMSNASQWTIALLMFASENNDRLPDSLERVTNYLGGKLPGVSDGSINDHYELMYKGSLKDLASAPGTIILREKEATPKPGGGLLRTYSFADGHTEIHAADDGDFSAWEAQHTFKPTQPAQ
ncbi:MAG TPA: sigma-70 family RNA polymerase sigma factor [Verrucomicrobiae bacterium]|nr:sigma-70 family RNA polymerase sigma factor [Verrucomicrobiae bacterium]